MVIKDLNLSERGTNMGPKVDLVLPGVRPNNGVGEPSWRRYNIILVPRYARELFPGYNEPFALETDKGEVEAWITSAPGNPPRGDPVAGRYICTPRKRTRPQAGSLSEWYTYHPELEPGDVLTLSNQEPLRYDLSAAKCYDYLNRRLNMFRSALTKVDHSISELQELPAMQDVLAALERTKEVYSTQISTVVNSLREFILRPIEFNFEIGPDGLLYSNLTPEQRRQITEGFQDSIGR